jgi:hypothetical protein
MPTVRSPDTHSGPARKLGAVKNGTTELTAVTYNIYLSGRWAPDGQVPRVCWLPGDHG